MTELEHLRSENSRMHDLLNRRPALNAGLVAEYVRWSHIVHVSEIAACEVKAIADGAVPVH